MLRADDCNRRITDLESCSRSREGRHGMNKLAAVVDPAPASSTVGISVVDVQSVNAGKLFALATVEIDIDGVIIVVHGIQALRNEPAGTRIEYPKYRDATGVWRTAVTLPDEMKGPIGDAVLDVLVERGIALRRVGPFG
jgi:stage V sporulation protein G